VIDWVSFKKPTTKTGYNFANTATSIANENVTKINKKKGLA
jgi:hypothetical protein